MSARRTAAFAIAALCVSVAAFAGPSSAQAQSVRVERIRGPGGRAAQRQLSGALESAGVSVSDDAAASVSGRIARQGRRHVLRLTLSVDGSDESLRFSNRNTGRLVQEAADAIAEQLGAGGSGGTVTEIEPVMIGDDGGDEPSSAPASSGSSATPAAQPSHSSSFGREVALEFSLGVGWMTRLLSFNDDIGDQVGEYALPAAVPIYLSGRWLPLLHWTSSPLAGVGVQMSFFGAPGVSSVIADASEDEEETRFPSTIDEFTAGLVYRIRLMDMLGLEAAFEYGETRFRVDSLGPRGPNTQLDPVPSVRYRFIRPALGLTLHLPAGFVVRAGAGWRGVVDAGPIANSDWFPNSFTTGLDVSGDVTWRFDTWVAVRAHVNHTRYITDNEPEPGDRRVIGGAADEWTRVVLELVVTVPGVP